MLSHKGPTPPWDFPPSDLKRSKSPILDFRFNNNQEIMKMVSTIARSSSAAKNKPPKKNKLLTPPFHTKPVSKLPSYLFLPFYCHLKSLSSPPLLAWGLGGVHHNLELSLGKLNKHGGGGTTIINSISARAVLHKLYYYCSLVSPYH